MKTTSFASGARRAVITHLDGPVGGFSIDLYAGAQLLRHRATGSWSTAVGIAKEWVGRQARVIA